MDNTNEPPIAPIVADCLGAGLACCAHEAIIAASVAAQNSLANVFVRLQGNLPQTPAPTEPVVIDQHA